MTGPGNVRVENESSRGDSAGGSDSSWRQPQAGLWIGVGATVMFAMTVVVGVTITTIGLVDYTAPDIVQETSFEIGERIYAQSCASCHGALGEGRVGPALNEGQLTIKYPDPSDHRAVIVNGRGAMPSFARQLSSSEIDAVVEYERSGL